jgi:hypothetical protein
MVAFKTPIFPHLFERAMRVNVILRQDDRVIETVNYHYLSTCNLKENFCTFRGNSIFISFFLVDQCASCRAAVVNNQTSTIRNVSNKRTVGSLALDDFEVDSDVPNPGNARELRQAVSQTVSSFLILK